MGNYASKGDSYTVSETNSKFYTKSDIDKQLTEMNAKLSLQTNQLQNSSLTLLENKLQNLNTHNVWCADGQICQLPPKSPGIKLGEYTLLSVDKQLCLAHSTGTFCFDGKIITPK
jgi:hypothetical protein